jgi:hypothetical protein
VEARVRVQSLYTFLFPGEGPDRAYVRTTQALLAGGLSQRLETEGCYPRSQASEDEIQDPGSFHFIAYPDTLTTQDAAVRIQDDVRVAVVDGGLGGKLPELLRPKRNLEGLGQVLQAARSVANTVLAIQIMMAHQELKGRLSQAIHPFGSGVNTHLRHYGLAAREHREVPSLHFNETESASAEGFFPLSFRTQVRNVGPIVQGGPEDLFPCPGPHRLVVQEEIDFFAHCIGY